MKPKKKILKKVLIVFLCIVLLLPIGYFMLTTFAPIDWGVTCAGGFAATVIRSEKENIEEALNINLTERQLWEIQENWKIEGRDSWSFFTDENGDEVKISGKQGWGGKLNWSYM